MPALDFRDARGDEMFAVNSDMTEVPSPSCDFCTLLHPSFGQYDNVVASDPLMKLKIDRIISIATLLASLLAIILVLKKPAPVAQPQSPAAIAANAQSFQQKMEQLEQPSQQASPVQSSASASSGNYQTSPTPNRQSANQQSLSSNAQSDSQATSPSKAEVHVTSDEVGAALAQALGGELTPDSNVGSGAPAIKDQQVSFDGDTVHGQFLTEIAGKDVWVTVAGHLASRDGYATFEPTEFKVGDLNVPVSLVNPALQKKLAEQRDRLKLPDFVGDLKVENGELVMQQK